MDHVNLQKCTLNGQRRIPLSDSDQVSEMRSKSDGQDSARRVIYLEGQLRTLTSYHDPWRLVHDSCAIPRG